MLFFLWVICFLVCDDDPYRPFQSFSIAQPELLKPEYFRGHGAMGAPANPRRGGLPCPAIRIVVSPSPSS